MAQALVQPLTPSLNGFELAAIDPTLSLLAPASAQVPGTGVDPSKIFVSVNGVGAGEWILLCNSSTADRSYCVSTAYGSTWKYAGVNGSINMAAGSAIKDANPQW